MQARFSRPADQLGIVVPDLEAEIKRWLERGVGPFFTVGGAMLSHYEYRGASSSPRVSAAFGQVGPLQLELIQPIDDEPSIYREFVNAGGNGLHHLGWFSQDLERDRAAESAGNEILQTGTVVGTPFAYYELAELGAPAALPGSGLDGAKGEAVLAEGRSWDGRIAELLEPSDMGVKAFTEVREAAASWDGDIEPVRHLLGGVTERAFELQTMVQRIGRWFRERAKDR